jgi:2-hydroxychromene-2-carboxylate isomerase
MKNILFYFDFISPYTYLAVTQLPALLKETSSTLTCMPVLLAGLLNAHGQKGPAEIPAKRRYTFIDCLRWARHYGVSLQGPPTHPFNPLPALRMTLALESELRWSWIRRVMDACWVEGKDISQQQTLLILAKELNLEGQELWDQSQTPEVKMALRRNTEEAIQKGVFGVPSFLLKGELFWGADRLEFLKSFLKGQLAPTEGKIDEMLKRPSSATR